MTRSADQVILGEQPHWWKWAACADTDPDLFFPPVGDNRIYVSKAKAVCATCVARPLCLEFAIANREHHGIWGGMTVDERRLIIRQRRKAARAA